MITIHHRPRCQYTPYCDSAQYKVTAFGGCGSSDLGYRRTGVCGGGTFQAKNPRKTPQQINN